jgi:hypothetical protein
VIIAAWRRAVLLASRKHRLEPYFAAPKSSKIACG